MSDLKKTRVGREESKGDLAVMIRKSGGSENSYKIESKVEHLFGEQIEATVKESVESLGISGCEIEVTDEGAFDYVITARIEAAARRLFDIEEPGLLPELKVKPGKPVKERLRRSRLYMPGNNPALMLNGGLFGADCVILDLEDSVAPAEKDAARVLVRNTLMAIDFGGAEKIVRINPLSTEYGEPDIEMVVPARPDTLLIPKCEVADDVVAVEKILQKIEKKSGIKDEIFLMPLIETAAGILNAREIAASSPRVVALCFGAEDFTADMGIERTREGRESFVARSLLVLGARAAGVQAIDTVFSDIGDTEGLIESTKEAMALGFEGKGVIHPAQIKPVHSVFAPSPERIEYAKKVINAIEEARKRGSGVATLRSKMIDAPIETRARKIMNLAEALGLIEKEE